MLIVILLTLLGLNSFIVVEAKSKPKCRERLASNKAKLGHFSKPAPLKYSLDATNIIDNAKEDSTGTNGPIVMKQPGKQLSIPAAMFLISPVQKPQPANPVVIPQSTGSSYSPAPIGAFVQTTAIVPGGPTGNAPIPAGSSRVLYSGSGLGSYYYDVSGQSCPNEAAYPENKGIPTCESFLSGNHHDMLYYQNNYMVAMDDLLLSNNRALYCGKRVIVHVNGVLIDRPWVVWDACGSCERGARLDFSKFGLVELDPNACSMGLVPKVTWEVVDEQMMPFTY